MQRSSAAAEVETGASGPTLVVQTAFLGDVILTIPLLAALAERHGPVDVLVTPAAAPLIETHPAVRTVLTYDKHGTERGVRAFIAMTRRLRSRGYQRAYLPHRSWRTAFLVLAAGIRERVGYDGVPPRWTYTERRPRPRDMHETQRLLALAGSGLVPAAATLALTQDDRARAARWLRTQGLADGFVALAPGSVWGTKRWPYYADLAARLSGEIVVIGGRDAAALGEEIVQRAPGRAAAATGTLSLRESAALLERAALLVTNDSAPLHMGSMLGTPMVVIFGPTVPAFGFGPLGTHDVIVEHPGLECRPCSGHGPAVCPLGHHRCMTELHVDTVATAVVRVLDATGGSGAIRGRG